MTNQNFKATNPRVRIFTLVGCTNEGLDPALPLSVASSRSGSPFSSALRRGALWLAHKMNSYAPPEANYLHHAALQPNYEKSVCDVYHDFTGCCIACNPGVLDVLSHVLHYSTPRSDEFPTWVPKFHERVLAAFFLPGVFSAGIASRGRYRSMAQVQDNPLLLGKMGPSVAVPNILRLTGFRVDTMANISQTVTQNLHQFITIEEPRS